MRPLLKSRDVAELLGVSIGHWYRRRPELEARGFPPPVPSIGNRWDPEAIEAWLRRERGEGEAEGWAGILAGRLDNPAPPG